MIRLIAFLLSCSLCLAKPWPISTAYPFEVKLWSGTAKITGATVTCSIGKDTDANGIDDSYWTGSAWGSYTALSMTEESGNAHLSGKYLYLLSAAAVGSTSNVIINFSSTYTSGITVWTTDEIETTLPSVISGAVASLAPNAITYLSFDDGAITDDAWDVTTSGGLTTEQDDMLTAIFGKLGATTVTVQSQVASNGTITIVEGDDYTGGSALVVTRTNWPGESIVGGTVTFSLMTRAVYNAGTGDPALSGVSCTFTNGGTGSTIAVTIPLTAAQTSALTPSPGQDPLNYVYQIRATTTGGNVHTLFLGACTVRRAAN